jgi:hypothetical protein
MLARLLDALVARRDIPEALAGWADRSAAGGFASFGACLDELERSGTEAAAHGEAEPPGLSTIFNDDELDAMERHAARVPGRRRRIAAAVAGAIVAALTGLALVDPGAHAGRAASVDGAGAVPITTLAAAPTASAPKPANHRHAQRAAKHRKHRKHHRPVPQRLHRTQAPATPAPTTPATPAPSPTPTPSSTPTTGPTVLPAPGGATLPAP